MDTELPELVEAVHLKEARLLRLTWADDFSVEMPLYYLRGWCPCAACQGHEGSLKWVEPAAGVTLLELAPIGNYALGFSFSDDHFSGIYSYEYLRRLARGYPGPPLKGG